MIRRTVRLLNVSFTLSFVFALALVVTPCYGEPMTMSPYKIVLNSECAGDGQDIQAIISRPLDGLDVKMLGATLYFDGTEVTKTTDIRYCYLDGNFLITFSRDEIHDFCVEAEMPSGIVTAKVAVYLVDDPETELFGGEDSVEILAPGNKVDKGK